MLAELQAMNSSDDRDNHFRLTADIDAAATQGWNGGEGFHPIKGWRDGGLNGANHTIASLLTSDIRASRTSQMVWNLMMFSIRPIELIEPKTEVI